MLTLRNKTYLLLLITSALFFGIVFLFFYQLRNTEIRSFQRKDAEEKLLVAERIMENELENLAVKQADWARWDDTYKFIQDRNEAYIESNLNDESLQTVGVHIMAFVNNSGELVYAKQVYSGLPGMKSVPEEILHYFLKGSTLIDFTDLTTTKRGVLTTKDHMLLLSAQRITTSDGKAPRLGTLIFASYLDAHFTSRLSNLSGVKVDVYPYGFTETKDQMTPSVLRSDTPNFIDIQNDRVTGYHLVNNIFENPALILKIEYPAEMVVASREFLWKDLWYLLFGMMAYVSILIVVIDISLLRRIENMRQIARQVSTLQAGEPPATDVDDFGHLATVMMNMIKENQQCKVTMTGSQGELEKFKMAFDQNFDHIIMTDSDGKILYANLAAQHLTGFSREEMEGKTPALWGKQMSVGFYKEFWDTIRLHKKIFEGEVINKHKSGNRYKAFIRVTPILDEKKQVLYFIGIERALGKA